MIDTSSTKPKGSALKQSQKKTVATYKGMKVQSDNEEEERKSGSGTTSHDSADDYFNQQRQLIRNKLTASSAATSLFSKEDL
jgi:hypothetical protein